ncbi:sugar/nucleoside kinase (ribokinase family) [Silvibacterium bohemicum]|uniref:Sugar/nucleoside kinase (Ribokinase family) n=1 Tax=Silvibacterium bohemicum TaxID=1577686 RepID=A0A841JQK2_9BACT|nr:sugar kinase [Silvibacterium bohemicum]MBB6143430.1 sugar/nucleoside kinase (ribokinase family) [Silvibacterium bohemicum]
MSGADSQKRFDVTLVGESNIDLLLYGLPDDLPPERELLADRMAMHLGGSPAITAHNLVALGSRVGFVTASAGDTFADLCLRDLTTAGVDLSRAIRKDDGLSTGFTVLLQHSNFRRTLTYPGVTHSIRYCDLDLGYLRSARHFHLSSYFLQENLRPDIPRLLAELKEAGLTISFDPNDDPSGEWDSSIYEALAYVDILLPNEREACRIARVPQLDIALHNLAAIVPTVVVKRGAQGAVALTNGKRYTAIAAPVTPVDAVGAGDSFNAGFLHAYLKGEPIDRCLAFGNLAGAFSTTQAGGIAAFCNADERSRFFANHAVEAR